MGPPLWSCQKSIRYIAKYQLEPKPQPARPYQTFWSCFEPQGLDQIRKSREDQTQPQPRPSHESKMRHYRCLTSSVERKTFETHLNKR